jgi:uncharacterized DUF497 family protein
MGTAFTGKGSLSFTRIEAIIFALSARGARAGERKGYEKGIE